MRGTKFGQNFFDSTRGRVLDSIRSGICTVEEISRRLELTDNAVRAHLATLERDRLIEQHGLQRGSRKPHYAYRLTAEAEQLFPKAYHTLLSRMLRVMKLRLKPELLHEILHEVAQELAAGMATEYDAGTAEGRAAKAVAVLEELGGAARVENEGELTRIRSNAGCPFSEVVTEHPEICRLAETLLSDITRTSVREKCERGGPPRCSFEFPNVPATDSGETGNRVE